MYTEYRLFIPIVSCTCSTTFDGQQIHRCIRAVPICSHSLLARSSHKVLERMSQHLPPAHERGEVTPQMTAQDRGRLPDHVAQPLMWAVGSTMKRERRARRSGACKRAARLARRRKQMSTALVMHWRSCDKVNRPVTGFHLSVHNRAMGCAPLRVAESP